MNTVEARTAEVEAVLQQVHGRMWTLGVCERKLEAEKRAAESAGPTAKDLQESVAYGYGALACCARLLAEDMRGLAKAAEAAEAALAEKL